MSWNGEERRRSPRAEMRVPINVQIVRPAPPRPGNEEIEIYFKDLADCSTCQRYASQDPLAWGPSHDGSKACEAGSIAAGGDRAHCSCAECF